MIVLPEPDYSIKGVSWAHERREVHVIDYNSTVWEPEHREVCHTKTVSTHTLYNIPQGG